jgi:hypothetical protein
LKQLEVLILINLDSIPINVKGSLQKMLMHSFFCIVLCSLEQFWQGNEGLAKYVIITLAAIKIKNTMHPKTTCFFFTVDSS